MNANYPLAKKLACLAVVIVAGLSSPAVAAPTPRIYIACDDHTDYMWSADASTYRKVFLEMIDYYLARADATDREPSNCQARFNCDGSLWMWEYERNRPPADFQRLIRRIKDSHISVPLNPITMCYGAMPAEGLLRAMYYAGRIERRYGLRLPTAHPMEDQTMPYGLGSLFAGAGAKYCWMGICGCASRLPDNTAPRTHEIYWWTGLDGRRILIKWNSLVNNNNTQIGGYAEARKPAAVVDYLVGDAGFNSRWKYPLVKAAFGKGHDDLKTLTTEFETVARDKTTSQRTVRNSNEVDFYRDFEATYGAELPSYAAAFGNEWDLYPASMAEVSARVKRSIEKLRTAEAMAVLASLSDSKFMPPRDTARDQAFMNMGLYFNHAWTGDGAVSRDRLRDWAKGVAGQIETYVDALHHDAGAALGVLIATRGEHPRFYAFNPLSWTRTDAADFAYAGSEPLHVVDLSTGEETPSQRLTIDGKPYLRVLAENVPSVGYKVFELRPGVGKTFADAATVTGPTIETSIYRIIVDGRGAITSLIDKARDNRELAAVIDGRAINDFGEGPGQLAVENAGPVSVTLKAVSSATLPHTTRVTLFHNSRRIDIRNEITENFHSTGDSPPRWTFSFRLQSPDIWHEEVGAVIRAKLLSAGGHYSPVHARYDWQTLNHFADISGPGVGVTVANADCLFMKAGRSTVTALDASSPQINVLAGGLIDGEKLGISRQGGDSRFLQRFALQTHGTYDQAEAMRFALAHQNPLATGAVTGSSPHYPDTSYSLLSLSDPNVLLWSVKPAEDGIASAGIALRVWNMSHSATTFAVSMGSKTVFARHSTHIETPIGASGFADGSKLAAAPDALETYLLSVDKH
jgi:alpha-mannosidase